MIGILDYVTMPRGQGIPLSLFDIVPALLAAVLAAHKPSDCSTDDNIDMIG